MFLYFNVTAAILGLMSLLLYTFVYTPLKRVGPIAVFIGAIPGALPPLIGWVAFTGNISIEAIIIFSIQFIWQFPHFWAIAWIYHDDYKKVGFKLLPGKGEKNFNTALNIMTYTLIFNTVRFIANNFWYYWNNIRSNSSILCNSIPCSDF